MSERTYRLFLDLCGRCRFFTAMGRYRVVAAMLVAAGSYGLATNAIAQVSDADSSAEVERIIELVRTAYEDARKALGELPRDQFDTDSVLDASDYDAQALVTWVERNTRWVPYSGVLRGANGVLLDRRGNSLDRSLLLVRLLEEAGYDARLVRGRLSADAVAVVMTRAALAAADSQPTEEMFVDDLVAAAARASDEAAELAALVAGLPRTVSPEAIAAAADHWWVEAQLDNGWTAADSLLSGPMADMRPAVIERFSAANLPDSLFHHVTFRVVIERWDGGKTVEEVPLEYELRSADATYHDLELQFVPYHFDVAPAGSSAADETSLIAATAEEWLPVLRRGREVVQQQGFDQQGNLERDPGRIAIARSAEAATAALQSLGRSNAPDPSQLTAVWLEYQVEVPGRDLRIVRREIVDLVGTARRRSGATAELAFDEAAVRERGRSLLGVHRVLVVGAEMPPIALEKAAQEFWANHGPQIAGIVRLVGGSDDAEVLQRAYAEPLIALDLLSLATARHLLSTHRTSIYLGSPNILASHFTVESQEPYSVRRAFDLVVNDVGVVVNDSESAGRIRMEQGVLDTILEAAMSEPDGRSGNAAELFALRGNASDGWHQVDADSPRAEMPAAARARVADALAAGRIVVAPARLTGDLEPAWWEIDPATGTTLGIGSRGWGQSGVSDATMRSIGAGGVREGTKNFGLDVSCAVLGADLITLGLIKVFPGGGLMMHAEALRQLIRYGCAA